MVRRNFPVPSIFMYSNASLWEVPFCDTVRMTPQDALDSLATEALALPGLSNRPKSISRGWKLPPLRDRTRKSGWRLLGTCGDSVHKTVLSAVSVACDAQYGDRPDPLIGYLPQGMSDGDFQSLYEQELAKDREERRRNRSS